MGHWAYTLISLRYCQLSVGTMQTKALHFDGLLFTLFALSILLCPKCLALDISVQKIKYLSINDIFQFIKYILHIYTKETTIKFMHTTKKYFICPYEKR